MTAYCCVAPQLLSANFQGADGSAGPISISVPGVKQGDVLLAVSSSLGVQPGANNYFYQTVQADDLVNQIYGGDLSAVAFKIALLRFV